MEKTMEATIQGLNMLGLGFRFRIYIGIMGKKMKTTIVGVI